MCLSISNENNLAYYKLSIRKIFNKIESTGEHQISPNLALCRGRARWQSNNRPGQELLSPALWQSSNRPGQALLSPDLLSIYVIQLLQSFCF